MTTRFVIITLSLVCFCGFAQDRRAAFFQPSITAPAPTQPNILVQDFESGTTPTRWLDLSSGTVNWNYTPALLGAFSLGCTNGAIAKATNNAGAAGNGEIFGFFIFSNSVALPGSYTLLLTVSDASDAMLLDIYVSPTSQLASYDSGFSHLSSTVSTMAANTRYYVWFHFKKGAGSQVVSVAFSTTLVEPTSGNNFAGSSNGSGNTDAVYTYFNGITVGNGATVFDHIGIATTDSMSNGW